MKRDSLSKVQRVKPKIIPADEATDLKAILRKTSLNHVRPNFLHSMVKSRVPSPSLESMSAVVG